MKLLASIIALYFCFQANGQIFIDKISGTDSYQPTIAIYGTDPMKHRIPYNRIKGTPFWKPDWQLASFYDSNAVRIYTLPVKYNLATHEVHYQLKGEELVLDNNAKVSAIVFHNNNDSSSVGTLFVRMVPHLLFNNKPFNGYVQTMNLGKVQLMKLTNRNVVPFEDSLFHTQKRYQFKDANYYFLKTDEKVQQLKKLNDETLLSIIPKITNTHRVWIAKNNLDLRKEEDVILFLSYYNVENSSSSQ